MEGPFKDPEIADGERTVFRGFVGVEEAGGGVLVVERRSEGSQQLYGQSLTASVGESEYHADITFRRRSGTIHAERYRLETRQRDGAAFAAEEARFRHVRVLQWGGEQHPYPRDLTPLLGCAVALRGLEFERGAERTFSVWLANTVFWECEAKVEQAESVDLPVGRADAWRVRVRPSLEQVDRALDKLVAGLLPPILLHFAEEPPHRLLRLEFPTGPFRWNPRGRVEATALDP
jgi:hypothetical protein